MGQRQTSNLSISDPSYPKAYNVPLLEEEDRQLSEMENDVPRPTSLRMLLTTPTQTVHRYWRKFDNTFMRPVFGGRGFVPFVPGSPTERSVHQQQWD